MALLKQEKDGDQTSANRVNILIVDDLPEKLVVYETILKELNQNLIFAHSGEEALRQILKNDFAVILLDVNMPGMDGFEVASIIRSRKKSMRTPIIFLTAFTDDVQVTQGYASGAVDYLPTPVVPEILKAKIRVFIELYQMRQQAAAQAEEAALRAAAEEAARRKDEFLGMLAHELRNPLGPIRNAVCLLQSMKPDDAKWPQLRGMIERQVTHMARLIDDLLDSTRLSRGQIWLRKERCDLEKIFRQTAEDYKPIFDASGIRFDIVSPDEPVWIDGDSTRLVQIIGNLLHNAHKFTDPGGSVRASLSSNAETRIASIHIADTGVGIAPDILPHIFEVFRQGEQGLDRKRGGLGLGLSLAKGLVELHDGRILASSDGVGKGALFCLQIPTCSVPAELFPEAGTSFATAKACRVLVIEDNRDAAQTVGWLLDRDGYDVKIAYSGPEGLETAKTFKPKVILCDIGLPGMNGYEVVQEIRRDPGLSDICVIALTGYGREEDMKMAQEAGFNHHLTKPVDHAHLRKILSGVNKVVNN